MNRPPLSIFKRVRLHTQTTSPLLRLFHNSPSISSSSSPTSPNFYTLFPTSIPSGAPPNGPFAIDARALQREFFQLQQRAHPDAHHHHHNQHNHRSSTLSSSYINKAYSTLRDPLLRAQYLLSQRGINVEAEDAMLDGGSGDQELLMEVMECQEELETAMSEQDLIPLKEANDRRVNVCLKAIEEAFERDDLESARVQAVRLRYWRNLGDGIVNWEKGKSVVLVH